MQAPDVEVSLPVERQIADHADFTGQIEAIKTVDIRSRVTGYLDKVNFKHGAIVDEGGLLFEIDPRPYEAQVNFSLGQVAANEAMLKRAKADNARNKDLFSRSPGAVTRQDLDLYQAAEEQTAANLETSKATLRTNQLNLDWTKITAPFHGRLSRPFIDPGNLVKGDDTVLTRIVTLDPVFVYFDIDERTLLRLTRLDKASSASSAAKTDASPGLPQVSVLMALADEENIYPHRGTLDFSDNRVDPGTGTLRVRGVFSNPDGMLSPGLFVRVRVPVGEPHQSILVPERALGTDQSQKFLYVVDDKGIVQYRRVEVGILFDGWRAIIKGVALGEKIVVSGLQRVRPGIQVKAKVVDSPPPKIAKL